MEDWTKGWLYMGSVIVFIVLLAVFKIGTPSDGDCVRYSYFATDC
jgi:hypothetical protein